MPVSISKTPSTSLYALQPFWSDLPGSRISAASSSGHCFQWPLFTHLTEIFVEDEFRRHPGIAAADSGGVRVLFMGKGRHNLLPDSGEMGRSLHESRISFHQAPQPILGIHRFLPGNGFHTRTLRHTKKPASRRPSERHTLFFSRHWTGGLPRRSGASQPLWIGDAGKGKILGEGIVLDDLAVQNAQLVTQGCMAMLRKGQDENLQH